MVQRRDLMGGGLVAGLASLMATSAEAAPAAADTDDETANAVNRFREVYERQLEQVYDARWKGVTKVRQQQRTWLLATRKYPDFIEIGLDVWDNVYDWHVAYQQAAERAAPGRWTLWDGVHVHDLAAPVGSEPRVRRVPVRHRRPGSHALSAFRLLGALAGLAAQHREQHQRAISAPLEAVRSASRYRDERTGRDA